MVVLRLVSSMAVEVLKMEVFLGVARISLLVVVVVVVVGVDRLVDARILGWRLVCLSLNDLLDLIAFDLLKMTYLLLA